MNSIFATLTSLFAAADAPAPTAPAGSGAFNAVVIVFIALIAMFFLFILPKRSQDKQAQKLVAALKVNDKVLTTCGIIGTIYSIDKEGGEVVLKVDETTGAKIRFSIGAIYFVFNKEAAEKAAKDKEKDKGAKEKSAKK